MTETTLYINTTCSVRKGQISRNQQLVWQNKGTPVADFLRNAYENCGASYPKFFKMDKLSKLGWLSVEYLLKGVSMESYAAEEVGIVLSNENASLDADVQYFDSIQKIPSPALFVYTLPNIVIGEISIRHGFKGENAFFISRIFDAGLLHFYVDDLMQRHGLKACICGWVDVFGEEYDASVWLVTGERTDTAMPFTIENLIQSYQSGNGRINAAAEGTDHSATQS